jgi:hypothetical protein
LGLIWNEPPGKPAAWPIVEQRSPHKMGMAIFHGDILKASRLRWNIDIGQPPGFRVQVVNNHFNIRGWFDQGRGDEPVRANKIPSSQPLEVVALYWPCSFFDLLFARPRRILQMPLKDFKARERTY